MNTVKIRRRKPRKARSYHHGDLRRQLIRAAEEIILERGVGGFTLREAARRLSVSPAAPSHHFGDAKGLLGEVALLGFREFGNALDEADRLAGPVPADRLRAQGKAYVLFALKWPARFLLMFQRDKYSSSEELVTAGQRSFQVLERAIRAACGLEPTAPLNPQALGLLAATWSAVHGFAHLVLGGEMDFPMAQAGGRKATVDLLLSQMLDQLPTSPNMGSN